MPRKVSSPQGEVISVREFEDAEGKKIETKLKGGIIEIVNYSPSPEYIDKLAQEDAQEAIREMDEAGKKFERIQAKLREMAEEALQGWQCSECSYIYDPEAGDSVNIEPGTAFKDLPDNWTCPDCGADKSKFKKYEKE